MAVGVEFNTHTRTTNSHAPSHVDNNIKIFPTVLR